MEGNKNVAWSREAGLTKADPLQNGAEGKGRDEGSVSAFQRIPGCARRGVNRTPRVLYGFLALALLWAYSDCRAWAYIDPGTGAQVYGSVWPMLAILGAAVVAMFGFARIYVFGIFRAFWRHRLWCIPLMALASGAALWLMLA